MGTLTCRVPHDPRRSDRCCCSVAACGTTIPSPRQQAATSLIGLRGPAHGVRRRLADRSLTELGERVRGRNPGTRVTFSFGSSSGVGPQIARVPGRRLRHRQPGHHGGGTTPATPGTPVNFGPTRCRSRCRRATRARSPGWPTRRAALKVAMCAAAGAVRHGRDVFAAAGITASPDTQEQDVKAALAKVARRGGRRAGLSDRRPGRGRNDVEGIDFPEAVRSRQHVPDRHVTGPKPPRRPGVRRLRAVARGRTCWRRAGFCHRP